MNNPTDSNGRMIRVGDEDRKNTNLFRIVVGFDGKTVRFKLKRGEGGVYQTHCSLWTTTHRMGEPIEDVSPMARDRNGEVVERGKRVQENATVDIFRIGTVQDVFYQSVFSGPEYINVRFKDDAGNISRVFPKEITVIPEKTTRKLTLEVPDDASLVDSLLSMEGVRKVESDV